MILKLRFVPKINDWLRRNSVTVNIGEYIVASSPTILATWALGSCVSIILFDPFKKIGSLSHCMLPEPKSPSDNNDPKYVCVAITNMLDELERVGSNISHLRAAIIGGANIFKFAKSFDIGKRNVQKAIALLRANNIPIDVMDTGGSKGRNVVFLLSTGEIMVSYTIRHTSWRCHYGSKAFKRRITHS